jgi:REP element-mobilizing transposase RayT
MALPKERLEPGLTYHIFNHAVGNDKLFIDDKNYSFFLGKVQQWILPVCDIYAFCLMPNHFHLLLKIKDESELLEAFEELIIKRLKINLEIDNTVLKKRSYVLSRIISDQFSHCYNSYVQAFNKVYSRSGGLMKEGFQRKHVNSEEYLNDSIIYIHCNPVIAGLVSRPEDWKHSSYHELISNQKKGLCSIDIIERFENLENFKYLHHVYIEKKRNEKFD